MASLILINSTEAYGIGGSLQRRETTRPGNQPEIEHYRFTANGNLQAYMYENLLYVHYGYDGGTTRTYKYSFDLNPNWVNGRLESVNFNPRTAMFYPNSYLNFNQDGYYTKHYYNGMERIASRLGDNNLSLSTHDPELQDRKDQLDSNIRRNIVDITGYEFLESGQEQDPDDPKLVFELPQVGVTGLQPIGGGSVYYYHGNHLGSTAFVTDQNQTVVQGFLYAPFGEITNEHSPMWQNGNIPKYAFNAKELDEETGMYYYEARYYAPPTFTSRDPLFEKYPTFSPYAYCANNPVKFIDPDGEQIRSPRRYAAYNQNHRFVRSNVRYTEYRHSSSTTIKYGRTGVRKLEHSPSPQYLATQKWNGIESQYNAAKGIRNVEHIAKFVQNTLEFINKFSNKNKYSIIEKQSYEYTDKNNYQSKSYYIVFDNKKSQEKFDEAQYMWEQAHDYITKNYNTTLPNGATVLNGEGWEKIRELGKSPLDTLLDDFKNNKKNYNIVEKEIHPLPTIQQTNSY